MHGACLEDGTPPTFIFSASIITSRIRRQNEERLTIFARKEAKKI